MGGFRVMATFEYDGKDVRVIPQWEITLGDLAFMRENFEVPGLVELEQGMADMEPVAWRAILVASIRQSQPNVNAKSVQIDHVPILPIVMALNEEREAHYSALEDAAKAAKRDRPTSRSRSTRGRSGAPSSA